MQRGLRSTGLLALLAIVGCDEKPPPKPVAEAPTVTAAPAPPKPPPDPLAGLSVDELGLFLQTQRVDMTAKDAEEKIKAIVGALPVKQKTVPVAATRNAKTQHVGALARALGEAGAAQIDVKTPDRSGAEAILKLLPQELVSAKAPDCAVVSMVKKDNTSAVWKLKGGTASKFSKGLAGPDLSMTYDGMKGQMTGCAASQWFLAGEQNVIWGLVFDLGQVVAKADPPPKATEAVLLYEAPIAGRAVALRKR
ncbi:MAG TPA: hypothetical protein VJT73_20010 [Polyangiaceae bacterium]|nr:hypothetical protein [Polyangiaceae bacterium]